MANLIQLTTTSGIHDHGVKFSISEIARLIPIQDRADIARCSREELQGWAKCLTQRVLLNRGIAPAGWVHTLVCDHCGPVKSWRCGSAINCEWCHVDPKFRVTG